MNKDENEGARPASFDHDKEYQPHGPLTALKEAPLIGVHKEHMAIMATQSSWDEHHYPTSHLGQGFAFEEGKEFLAGKMHHKKSSKVMQSRSESVSESVTSNDSKNLVSPFKLEEGQSLPKVELTRQPVLTRNWNLKIFGMLVLITAVALLYYLLSR